MTARVRGYRIYMPREYAGSVYYVRVERERETGRLFASVSHSIIADDAIWETEEEARLIARALEERDDIECHVDPVYDRGYMAWDGKAYGSLLTDTEWDAAEALLEDMIGEVETEKEFQDLLEKGTRRSAEQSLDILLEQQVLEHEIPEQEEEDTTVYVPITVEDIQGHLEKAVGRYLKGKEGRE